MKTITIITATTKSKIPAIRAIPGQVKQVVCVCVSLLICQQTNTHQLLLQWVLTVWSQWAQVVATH